MKLKKLAIYILIMLLLFQNSISRIFNNNAILNSIDEIFIIIALIISISNIISKKKINKYSLIILIFAIAFSIIGIISCKINSEFILSRVIVSCFLSIKFFILIFAVLNTKIKEEDKEHIIEALEFWCKVVIIIAIFNILFPNIYKEIFTFALVTYRFGFVAVTSLFYHTGRYGWYMLFMALLYYSKYKKDKNKNDKIWMIICTIFSIFSFRTKVIISIVIIILLENIINKKIKLTRLITSFGVIFTIMIVFNNVIMNTYNLYFNSNDDSTARQALMQNSIKILTTYFPLGVGFGKYGSWYARKYYSDYYYKYKMDTIYGLLPSEPIFATDTFWPSIFGETGILGTIIYISMLIYIMKMLIKKKNILDKNSIYYNWAFFSLIQTICESFGEPSFNSPPQYIFVGLVIGIALNERAKKLIEKAK